MTTLLEKAKAKQLQDNQKNQFEITRWQTAGNIASGTTITEPKVKCDYCGKNILSSKIESHKKKCKENQEKANKNDKLIKELLENNNALKKAIVNLTNGLGEINQKFSEEKDKQTEILKITNELTQKIKILDLKDFGSLDHILNSFISQYTRDANKVKNKESSKTYSYFKYAQETKQKIKDLQVKDNEVLS